MFFSVRFVEMIFVTGASGLLGSYLTKKLIKSGKRIRALKRPSTDLALLGEYAEAVEWVNGDLSDVVALEEAMDGVEQVFHSAAVISFTAREVPQMMKANIEGAANVMNAALHAGVKRVVHVSSVAAFGLHKPEKVIDEKTVYHERKDMIHYYRSKQFGEREAWRANAEGLDVVVANPGTIIGAGRWDMEPNSVFRDVHRGLPFYTRGSNGFVDVRDAADALILLMEKGTNAEQYIVSAENKTFKTLLSEIANALQTKPPFIEVSAPVARIAVIAEWLKAKLTGKRQLLTPEMARLASMEFRFSNEKVKQLGATFRPVNATIAETAEVFKKSMKEGKRFGVFEE